MLEKYQLAAQNASLLVWICYFKQIKLKPSAIQRSTPNRHHSGKNSIFIFEFFVMYKKLIFIPFLRVYMDSTIRYSSRSVRNYLLDLELFYTFLDPSSFQNILFPKWFKPCGRGLEKRLHSFTRVINWSFMLFSRILKRSAVHSFNIWEIVPL